MVRRGMGRGIRGCNGGNHRAKISIWIDHFLARLEVRRDYITIKVNVWMRFTTSKDLKTRKVTNF